MNRKIIFIHESHFTKRDKARFGIDYFMKKKINVKLLNISSYSRPKYFSKYTPADKIRFRNEEILKNKKQIYLSLEKINSNDLVIVLFAVRYETRFIVDELKRRKIHFGYCQTTYIPPPPKSIYELLKYSIIYPIAALRKILQKIKNYRNYNNYSPSFLLCAGKKNYAESRKNHKSSQVIKIPDYDCDKYILDKRKSFTIKKNSHNYAVYLDRPYNHPDQLEHVYFPNEKPYNYNNWYNPLNAFFKKFIDVTDLELKIAVNPRNTYNGKNPYRFGKLYFNKTLELIKHSKIVLLHNTTAVNFAVLYNKPLIFLTGNNFGYQMRRHTLNLSSVFMKNPINMNKDFNYEKFLNEKKVDKKIYKIFKRQHIIDINYPKKTSYEILYDYFINNK